MTIREKFALADRQAEALLGTTNSRLVSAYKIALDEVRAKLGYAYQTYGVGGELTYAQMSRYNRMVTLEKELVEAMRDLGQVVRIESQRLGRATYSEAFYRAGWALETEVEASLGFGLLPRETIEAAVNLPLSGLSWSERTARDNAERIRGLRSTITQGLIRGDDYPRMAKEATQYMNTKGWETLRVVRTEAHRCQSMGTLAGLEQGQDAGLEGLQKTWLATLDSRTRPDHGYMDGVAVGVKEMFELPDGALGEAPGMTGEPRQDINCRCTMTVEPGDFVAGARRERGVGIRDDVTYSEWQKELSGR